jgi:hypothetical protein
MSRKSVIVKYFTIVLHCPVLHSFFWVSFLFPEFNLNYKLLLYLSRLGEYVFEMMGIPI